MGNGFSSDLVVRDEWLGVRGLLRMLASVPEVFSNLLPLTSNHLERTFELGNACSVCSMATPAKLLRRNVLRFIMLFTWSEEWRIKVTFVWLVTIILHSSFSHFLPFVPQKYKIILDWGWKIEYNFVNLQRKTKSKPSCRLRRSEKWGMSPSAKWKVKSEK